MVSIKKVIMKKFFLFLSLFILSSCSQQAMDHDMSMGSQDEMISSHHGEGINIPEHEALPEIDIITHKDPKSGWNVEIVTKNFRFAPEHASQDHISGEGHAHLYIDNKKIRRLYGEWTHVDNLKPGRHKIRVNLNANNHSPLIHDEQEIADFEWVVQE
jgi:hypothetical protein